MIKASITRDEENLCNIIFDIIECSEVELNDIYSKLVSLGEIEFKTEAVSNFVQFIETIEGKKKMLIRIVK